VGPVDRAAADLADRNFGIVIAKLAADEVIGHDMGVAVAPRRQATNW
jgi:hypothetical protein